MAALNARALLNSRREGRSLILSYSGDALTDVERLVQQEKECCAFLDFNITMANARIILTITAPADAENMLDNVFEPFEQGNACNCTVLGKASCGSQETRHKAFALTAAGFSALALTCGVCCILPFVAPRRRSRGCRRPREFNSRPPRLRDFSGKCRGGHGLGQRCPAHATTSIAERASGHRRRDRLTHSGTLLAPA